MRLWVMSGMLLLTATYQEAAIAAPAAAITVREVRTLPTPQLARELLGERLGSRVIESITQDDGDATGAPHSIVFFTHPVLSFPRLNGICSTDVITVAFNWFDLDAVNPATPLLIDHVEATSRYKAFPMPPGEPQSPENARAQAAACAAMATAIDAFRAPDPGDAQWLAAIQLEYARPSAQRHYKFACDDFADRSCTEAARMLPRLALPLASEVKAIDCAREGKDQIRRCFRLIFPYADSEQVEWEMSVVSGMANGMADVEIRSLKLTHQPRSFGVP
ncbi:MAG: hypothetical protein JWM65_3460 [Sphingomonas bacterium]|nr:hypothetical protein [Sphingomonas bacterium]